MSGGEDRRGGWWDGGKTRGRGGSEEKWRSLEERSGEELGGEISGGVRRG